MKRFRYLKNVAKLKLDEEKCTGCGRCIEVCPHQVFSLIEQHAQVIDRDACMECGACAGNCPSTAITVDAGVGCASGLMREWLRERRMARTGGNCCS